jgi:hypothetical protein
VPFLPLIDARKPVDLPGPDALTAIEPCKAAE